MKRAALVAILTSVAALACAGSGDPMRVAAAAEAVPQPETGPLVRIVRVSDVRTFYSGSRDPWKPSVSGADPSEREATRRVLGRSRPRSRGANVEAAEGETVESLVAGAIVRAFRLAGYRVLDPGDGADGSAATPVEAEIETLWTRPVPPSRVGGVWRFRCRLGVRVQAPLGGLAKGSLLATDHMVSRGGPNATAFGPLVRGCLERFAERLRSRVAPWVPGAPNGHPRTRYRHPPRRRSRGAGKAEEAAAGPPGTRALKVRPRPERRRTPLPTVRSDLRPGPRQQGV